jgi:hypothetical protein
MQTLARPCVKVAFIVLPWLAQAGMAAEPPDLSRIELHIAREPAYTSDQPLYALYLFGPEAKTYVWAVLDKSQPQAETYDVLYFDRDADGDLTAYDERIEGEVSGTAVTFDVGSFSDPQAGQTHTGITITRHGDSMVMLRMNWCGEVVVRGGYAPVPGPYTQFAPTKEEAPVLWPGADGVFSFQFWMVEPLKIGRQSDVRVFLGHAGKGPNTFCAVPDTFLPAEVPVLATLVYKDAAGTEHKAQSELRQRC